MISPKYTEQQ